MVASSKLHGNRHTSFRAMLAYIISLIFLPIHFVCSSPFSPLQPPAIPLAVRSPYLSTWISSKDDVLYYDWPRFWNTSDITAWTGLVNVDGASYIWMGAALVAHTNFTRAVQQSVTITSTQSNFKTTAGPVDLDINFLNPIEASDLVNLSFPFSYLSITVTPNDGKSHTVQLYTDISAEWLSGNDSMLVNWTTSSTSGIFIHQVQLENQTLFADVNDRIQYGSIYYATSDTLGLTYQTGRDIVVRAQFINDSVLLNTTDSDFRAIGNNDWPVFAFSNDLGSLSGQSEPVVNTIGYARDPVISYITADNVMQDRSSYFWTRWSTIEDAIATFLGDYNNALNRANNFDNNVKVDAANTLYPVNYVGIVELSILQALFPIEITVSKDSTGAYNTSDVTAFIREISSGTHVNCVDCIYAAWPAYLYTNPALAKALLIPLLEYAASGQYPNDFAVHDLGGSYPIASGWPSGGDLQMPVEETGNMLIMTLSAVQWTGDTSLITQYYTQLEQWASYLLSNTLYPADQLCIPVLMGPLANQTNLAIKGIIALEAMARMASLIGDSRTSSKYSSAAASYVKEWQNVAQASDGVHFTLNYGNSSSWSMLFNLYADQLLNTSLIPSSVYIEQTTWFSTQYQTYSYSNGVPVNTHGDWVISEWGIWTAAVVTSPSVQEDLIESVFDVLSKTPVSLPSVPFPDLWNASTGVGMGYYGRSQVGGHLALLALNGSLMASSPSSSSGASSSTSSPAKSTSSASPPRSHRDSALYPLAITICLVIFTTLQ